MPVDPSAEIPEPVLRRTLLDGAKSMGLSLTESCAGQLLEYLTAVLQENQHINVTAIRDPLLGVTQHLLDSLSVAVWWEAQGRSSPPTRLLDLGTGGGFPAAPLAAYWPDCHVLAIDGTGKKIGVVERSAAQAGLRNLHAQQVRGTDLRRSSPRLERFQLLTVRAVGPAVELLSELIPLAAPDGLICLMKGPQVSEIELSEAARFAKSKGFVAREPWFARVPGLEPRQILGYSRQTGS